MPAQPSWLAPQLLKSTISRDLGSQGGRRRINPAKASPSVRALRFGDRASSCGKKRGSGPLGFLGRGCGPFFRIAGLGRPPGVLSAAISPTKFSPWVVWERRFTRRPFRLLGFPRERLGILHKNSKVFRSPDRRERLCRGSKYRCFKQLQPQEHRSPGAFGWHSGCTVSIM